MKSLARVRQFVSKKLALDLYRSLVIPHIDYCDVVYDAIGQTDSRKLQKIQNRCLRICCKADPRTPISELHEACHLPKLADRRELHVCNLVHQGLNNKSSNNVNNFFRPVSNHHNVGTRSSADNKLVVPTTRLKICEQNVKVRGAKYYNNLPSKIRRAPSTNSFKSSARKYLYGTKSNTI